MTDDPDKKCDLKDVTIVIQSYIAQFAAVFICGVIVFHPPDMKDATVATLIGTVLGFLLSEAKNYSSYWTGTNKSSSDQQKTIAAMAATASAPPATATTTTTNPDGQVIVETKPVVVPPVVPPGPVEVVNAPSTSLKTESATEPLQPKEKTGE